MRHLVTGLVPAPFHSEKLKEYLNLSYSLRVARRFFTISLPVIVGSLIITGRWTMDTFWETLSQEIIGWFLASANILGKTEPL